MPVACSNFLVCLIQWTLLLLLGIYPLLGVENRVFDWRLHVLSTWLFNPECSPLQVGGLLHAMLPEVDQPVERGAVLDF